jgi:NAD-dependent DNA ligase
VSLNRFIKALSLPEVGITISSNIAEYVGDPAKLLGVLSNTDKLVNVKEVGKGIALSVSVAVEDPDFLDNYYALLDEITVVGINKSEREYFHSVVFTPKIQLYFYNWICF